MPASCVNYTEETKQKAIDRFLLSYKFIQHNELTRKVFKSFLDYTYKTCIFQYIYPHSWNAEQMAKDLESKKIDINDLDIYDVCCFLMANYSRFANSFFKYVYKNNLSRSMIEFPWKFVLLKAKNIVKKERFEPIVKNGRNKNNLISFSYDMRIEYVNSTVNDKVKTDRSIAYNTVVVSYDNEYCSKTLSEFLLDWNLTTTVGRKYAITFAENMSETFAHFHIKDIYAEISDEFIDFYFSKFIGKKPDKSIAIARHFIISILLKGDDATRERCKLYNINVLNSRLFTRYIVKNAKPVIYNIFDPVPEANIWFLIPNGEEMKTTRMHDNQVILVNFDNFKNPKMAYFAKCYFWYVSNTNIMTKKIELTPIREFCNMFFPTKFSYTREITTTICAEYKSFVLNKFSLTETRNGKIYPVSKFVKVLQERKLMDVDKSCFIYLTNRGKPKHDTGIAIPEDDLIKIAEFFDKHKADSLKDMMMYVIFHLTLNTEFRISQIINLEVNCVQKAMKENEYVIKSTTKVSDGEFVEQPCALVVKRIIDAYLKVSADFRSKCKSNKMKKYLFLQYDSIQKLYTPLSSRVFLNYLKSACKQAGTKSYTAKNLRCTYITNARQYVLKNNLSDMELLGITNHKSFSTVNQHYIQKRIRDAIQYTHKMIIGDIDIKGQIVTDKKDIFANKNNTVESECGFCQKDECTNSLLSCLLCKSFATTIDRIPFFEANIHNLNNQIKLAKYPHDVEDLTSIKRLCGAYLEALLIKKEEEEHE